MTKSKKLKKSGKQIKTPATTETAVAAADSIDRKASSGTEVDRKVVRTVSATYKAPLPPPSMLRDYENVVPGLADRIVQAFERETLHRHECARVLIDAEIKSDQVASTANYKFKRSAQWFAFILGLVGLLCGTYTATHGAPTAGSIIGGVTVVGLVSTFLWGKAKEPAGQPAAQDQGLEDQ